MIRDFNKLEREYKKKFEKLDKKDFIVINNSFEYLAEEFDLEQKAVLPLTNYGEPSIKTLTNTIIYIKEENIKTIYYEYGDSSKIAEILADEVKNTKILPLASMEYLLPGPNVDDYNYKELMEMNLENLYKGLAEDYYYQ